MFESLLKKATEEVTATATDKVTGTVAGATASVTAEAGKVNGTIANATNGVTQVAEEKKGFFEKISENKSKKQMIGMVLAEEVKNAPINSEQSAFIDQLQFLTLESTAGKNARYNCEYRLKYTVCKTTGLPTSIAPIGHVVCKAKNGETISMRECYDCPIIGTKISDAKSADELCIVQMHRMLGDSPPNLVGKEINVVNEPPAQAITEEIQKVNGAVGGIDIDSMSKEDKKALLEKLMGL